MNNTSRFPLSRAARGEAIANSTNKPHIDSYGLWLPPEWTVLSQRWTETQRNQVAEAEYFVFNRRQTRPWSNR